MFDLLVSPPAQCVKKLKKNKIRDCDGIVGSYLKYGGSGLVCLLEQLFSLIWCEELVPRQWQDRLIVNLFMKGDPGYYSGITLSSIVGKVFFNNRLVEHLDRGGILHERQGQAGK